MAVILMNDLGNITHWNDTATGIFGLAQESAVGRQSIGRRDEEK